MSAPIGRRRALVAAVLVTGLATGAAACGGGGGSEAQVGVSLEVRHTDPLRSGAPVRWTLVVRNDTPSRVDLRFPSGQDGDVVLGQGGRERYRWSADRVFATVVRDLRVGARETRTFAMEDTAFAVPPGDYDLVATLATVEDIPPAEEKVVVVR